MYQTSIEGIKNVLKECWRIYTLDSRNNDKDLTWFHKLAALKLAKECNEALFKLTAEGPSVMYVKLLEERLARIETREINYASRNLNERYAEVHGLPVFGRSNFLLFLG